MFTIIRKDDHYLPKKIIISSWWSSYWDDSHYFATSYSMALLRRPWTCHDNHSVEAPQRFARPPEVTNSADRELMAGAFFAFNCLMWRGSRVTTPGSQAENHRCIGGWSLIYLVNWWWTMGWCRFTLSELMMNHELVINRTRINMLVRNGSQKLQFSQVTRKAIWNSYLVFHQTQNFWFFHIWLQGTPIFQVDQ